MRYEFHPEALDKFENAARLGCPSQEHCYGGWMAGVAEQESFGSRRDRRGRRDGRARPHARGRDWIRRRLAPPPPGGDGGGGAKRSAEQLESENASLRRENDYLRQQRDILKKTLGILSETPASVFNGLTR